MRLDEIADRIGGELITNHDGAADVTGVQFDSRAVAAGDLFTAWRGDTADGHDFSAAAVANGASALLVERALDLDVDQVVVPAVRPVLGVVADLVYGRPSAGLDIVGITGTNGKTTTAFMVEAIFRAAGRCSGLTGTIETHIGDVVQSVRRTTPEAPELHCLLRSMVDAGVDSVVMEVSSHALDQGRVGGIRFDVAGFTNLTQDHLDYHNDMETYFEAKALLFTPGYCAAAAICVDDPYGRRLVETCRELGLRVATFGVGADDADIAVSDLEPSPTSTTMIVDGPWGRRPLRLPIGGTFNASNAACAAACCHLLGVDADAIFRGLSEMGPVPGRFQPVPGAEALGFGVVVDYAHTPDGVDNVLRAARGVVERGRVIVVFGAGGDRDRAKRPLMGAAAAAGADHVIVTSDNPRSESPDAIVAQILPGVEAGPASFEVEVDRSVAIERAVDIAAPGDLVVIAGKGHEKGQEINGVKRPFDDIAEATAAISRRIGRGGPR